ncbi:methyltransferase-like protein 6 [Strongylocentrotus purpuratus]|uniref:tRNA N(3)-methylcytidine methyltransferase n=1 Tax=Strongylocentrotus purpuratus TaxID=7668 RepID=A0A7M7RH65_STRPU|nr:methyltransferase-like protein 6 [Strongylocentrotus purpuratus]XP_794407.3 methyltransferase-like protein 6 [Strongylocentrotus purpuratus]|eukprot:XP_794407.3 PREDICTED: methyltransferase-like protein 6 [Strongylocentrotus purpuratus]
MEKEKDGGGWVTTKQPRDLTEAEKQKLAEDETCVSDFKQNKLELEAKKNWDLFYKRNSTNFFKDRHWTTREFEELIAESREGKQKSLLEVGCGVGNTVYPLLDASPEIFIHCCDFSPRAVQFVKEHSAYDPARVNAFQCDITCDDLTNNIAASSVDMVTMFFVLSAIHPDKMLQSIQNIYKALCPGGLVLFRDYGLHDHAMLRFSKGHKLSENFYVRQDGTRAFYFSTDVLSDLFIKAGFDVVVNEYVYRETVNKKEGLSVPRVFVQSKFSKKIAENS